MVETMGKVHQVGPGGVRVYVKPSLGKGVWRKSGVYRTSESVIKRNDLFTGAMEGSGGCPATFSGIGIKAFITHLRTCARNKNLGTGISKTTAYRRKFNKYLTTTPTVTTARVR